MALNSITPNYGDVAPVANYTNSNVLAAVASALPAVNVGRYSSLYDAQQVLFTFSKFNYHQRWIEPYTFGNVALTQFTSFLLNPMAPALFAPLSIVNPCERVVLL